MLEDWAELNWTGLTRLVCVNVRMRTRANWTMSVLFFFHLYNTYLSDPFSRSQHEMACLTDCFG